MTKAFTDHAEWEAANGEFLADSLQWLRSLLTSKIASQVNGEPAAPVPAAEPSARGAAVAAALGVQRLTHSVGTAADPTRVSVDAAEQISPPPALIGLATTFGLSRFERDTLLLCAAPELDPSIAALYAQAQGNPTMTFPSLALAMAILPDPTWSVVSPQQGLRYWRLLDIHQPAGQALTASSVRADERIVNLVKGLNYLDSRLEPLTSRLDADLSVSLPGSQQIVVDQLTNRWQSPEATALVIQLTGADDTGKQLVAAHTAARCGLLTYRMAASALPTQAAELDELARLWQRESLLLPVALYLDTDEAPGESAPPIAQFLGRLHCPVFLAVRESWPDLGATSEVFAVGAPRPDERAAAWQAALPEGVDAAFVSAVAGQFAIDVPTIRSIAATGGNTQQIWDACRGRTRPRLDSLATRLQPRVGWDDLVVPPEQEALLRQIADQVAHRGTVYEQWGFGDRITRGLGVSVLFTGVSGTGKTTGAEVLAAHLDLDLYRIDLSAVVSKYIGETEKNLRRLFDAAEGGGVILFFDEADALFGKRSDVKDAHDRYANTQTNDLLQRMESYTGLSILASNMRRSLDSAFMRRLRFIVDFPFPDTAERIAIWHKAFPAQAPVKDLDYERLAELRLTGGMARNIALNAAFMASATGSDITMPLVLQAARTEFRKLELPVRDAEFSWPEEQSR